MMKKRTLGIALVLFLLLSIAACTATATWPAANVANAAEALNPTPTPVATPVQAMADDAALAGIDPAAVALQMQVIAVHEAASPAVVNVISRAYVVTRFMGVVPQEGTGSGFVYDALGHIVTNYHVVEGADELLVTLANGEAYEATLVGSDPANDLAVLHIDVEADLLPEPLALADSDALRVGQFVLAIGNPYGLGQTLTTGVVSALGRVIQSPEDNRFIGEAIQTDAAINPGNSGGPLLDLTGRVIGVNSQIISPSGASSGIGFAVSSNTVARVVPQLIDKGSYAHPWLGTRMITLGPTVAQLLRDAGVDIPVESGLLVASTVDGGPAEAAGVRGGDRTVPIGGYRVPVGGDIVTAVDGQPVEDLDDLTVYLETQTTVGDTVMLTLLRDGETMEVAVTLAERPAGQ